MGLPVPSPTCRKVTSRSRPISCKTFGISRALASRTEKSSVSTSVRSGRSLATSPASSSARTPAAGGSASTRLESLLGRFAILQQIRAVAQIADQRDVILIGADLGRGDRAADAHFDITVVLVEKFMRKQRRAHSRMQAAQQLEPRRCWRRANRPAARSRP